MMAWFYSLSLIHLGRDGGKKVGGWAAICLDGGEGEGCAGLKSWSKTSALKNRGNEINIPPPNEKSSGDSRERKCSVKDEQKWGK